MEYTFLTENINGYVEGHLLPEDDSIQSFQEIFDIVQPKKILEIGFNAGHSAFMTLEMLPEVKLRSIDICRHKYTAINGAMLAEMYGNRFALKKADSKKINPSTITGYDMVFIDGDHSVSGVTSDLLLARDAKAKYILVDDYCAKWFQNIIDVVDHFVAKPDFCYEKVKTFNYSSRDGVNTAILLRKM